MPRNPESTRPIQGIVATPASPVSFREITKRSLPKFPITDEPREFLVFLDGKNPAGQCASVEWLFKARHPYMALGEALVRFYNEYFACEIEHWKVAEPCSKPRNNNKS